MQPESYPFSSSLRVLCERGVVEYPFSAAPAADGGNIGGVDQAANRLRLYPADGADAPGRGRERRSVGRADAAVAGCLERGGAPELGTGEQATAALRVSLAANRSLASGGPEGI